MKKLTNTQRADAAPILAAVVARPGFHVAMMWIVRGSGAVKARQGYPMSVGTLCLILELTWGAKVDISTMAVALETCGYKIGVRSFVHGSDHRELAVNIQRSSVCSSPWRTEQPMPERWLWARDAAPVPGAETLYRNLTVH